MSIFKKLLGGFELAIFLKQGVDRFEGTTAEAWRALALAIALIPVGIATTMIMPPLGTEDISPFHLNAVMVLESFVTFGLYVAILYGVVSYMEKKEGFALYITMGVWASLSFLALALPVYAAYYLDAMERKTAADILMWVALYWIAVRAFLIARAFKIPWELAAGFSIFGLFVSKTVNKLLFTAFDVPIVDYFDLYG